MRKQNKLKRTAVSCSGDTVTDKDKTETETVTDKDKTETETGKDKTDHPPEKGKKKKGMKCSVLKIPQVHDFTEEEIRGIRSNLVSWYRENKRDLPWRHLAKDPDINKRAYSVWVSEIMLQQTQVSTVIDYYNKWIQKWPTVQDLAKASLEEVNEMWSGLGYYSRGRRLHEGAQKVVEKLEGKMPATSKDLLLELPGVGRYTAGAISSIAYSEPTGLVDGNVVRVISRLRVIGADSASQAAVDVYWNHANKLVDDEHPGDFNQGMMELGATVCTPKTPACNTCPIQVYCTAYKQVEENKKRNQSKLVKTETNIGEIEPEISDIECLVEGCSLCLDKTDPWNPSLGVCNYPRKGKKKAAREERTSVCIVSRHDNENNEEYLISQRPNKGLLAGLWEFPSHIISENSPNMDVILSSKYGVDLPEGCQRSKVGEVVHIFSHIHQTYIVEHIRVKGEGSSKVKDEYSSKVKDKFPPKIKDELSSKVKDKCSPKVKDEFPINVKDGCPTKVKADGMKWVTKTEFMESAVSTAMKKVFKSYEKYVEETSGTKQGSKRKREKSEDKNNKKKQTSLNSFFKTGVK